MRLFRTSKAAFIEEQGRFHVMNESSDPDGWDRLICDPGLHARARAALNTPAVSFDHESVLAPIGTQEVWAAGVTYYRSRDARVQESKDHGGGTFYDRVYSAKRPELFFKATGRRVVGPGDPVHIRSDAKWSVPEPELTLLVNAAGNMVGCTIGNDMSARDIEGDNPLYLPQAKIYSRSCALGPCVLLTEEPSASITISLEILREGEIAFAGSTSLKELKRELKELVHFLFLDNDFPAGVFLMTGTGVVPNDDFALQRGDLIRISVDEIGTLENPVA